MSFPDGTVGPARVLEELTEAVTNGRPVVLATIVATHGSVPRHTGAKMVIRADGSILGTVGGGKVEDAVRRDALAALEDRAPSVHEYTLQDPDRGDPGVCGGIMTVYLEPYMPPHTIFVIGSGHVGTAVVDLAHWLGYRTVIVDDRADVITEDAVPNADVRFAGSVADAIATHPITEDTSVVVVTRSHELDATIVPLLVATPARYLGVMGSKRRWNATRAALDGEVSDVAFDRIHNPIGRDIGAETVEEIAVAILSEIIAINTGAGE